MFSYPVFLATEIRDGPFYFYYEEMYTMLF